MASTSQNNQVQGSKAVDWSKLCQSCATKKVIAMFSCPPFVEKDIHGCTDRKCVNFRDPRKEGRVQDSPPDELLESQVRILSHLQLDEGKETEKLRQLLAIPFKRMNQEQRVLVKEEIDKFYQNIFKRIGEKFESSVSTSTGICSSEDVATSSNNDDNY